MLKGMAAEMAAYHVIAYGALFLFVAASRLDELALAVTVVLALAYGVLAYFALRPAASGASAETASAPLGASAGAVQRVGLRRIGVGLLVSGIAAAAPLLQPFGFFLALDVLVALLPGRCMMVGRAIWQVSKVAYIAAAVLGIALLLINGLRVPLAAVLPWLTAGSGALAIALSIGLVVLVLAGMVRRQ